MYLVGSTVIAIIVCNAIVVLSQQLTVQTEFCSALEQLAASPASPGLQCTASDCTTLACTSNMGAVSVQFQILFSVCSDPPSLDTVIKAGGRMFINQKVEHSQVITTPFSDANLTFDQVDNAIAFQLTVSMQGFSTTLLSYTVLPVVCMRNISGSHFPCPPLTHLEPAQSVHQLKPSDVKVVGAMGDSLTAGLRVLSRDFFDVPFEDRGVAWSGGGFSSLEYVTTLPNILKQYNPELIGFATESENPINRSDQSLNVAVSGATTFDLLQQARVLVERIRNNSNITTATDWKLITILIGYTDLCLYSCHNNSQAIINSVQNIQVALDYLRHNLPRTFVNLVPPADITTARAYSQVLPGCRVVYDINCPCAYANDSHTALEAASRLTREFHQQLGLLVSRAKYEVSDDFTVVIQPFLEDYQPLLDENGRVDFSMVAVDCIHLSPAGNRVYATSLWKNMLQPVGSKTTSVSLDVSMVCPSTEFPYFYTRINTAGCPSLCSHAYCSKKSTRRAMCRLPGVVKDNRCTGSCRVTSCRACYYSESVRELPGTCSLCQQFPTHYQKCFQKWVTCIRRANRAEHGMPSRHYRSEDYFKCYEHPCPF